jgi:hypothetical protein
MMDPLLVWMKVEHCTLFVGCTSTFLEVDDVFTNTHDKYDNSYDKCFFGEGKLQYTKYLDSEYLLFHVNQVIYHHQYKLETDDDNNNISDPKKSRLSICKIFGFQIFCSFCVNHLIH